VEGFGKNGEWKKLEGTCLEKDTGEYVSSSCLVFFHRLSFVVSFLLKLYADEPRAFIGIPTKYVYSTRRDRSPTRAEQLTVSGTSLHSLLDSRSSSRRKPLK
jgi:hypothetical protein